MRTNDLTTDRGLVARLAEVVRKTSGARTDAVRAFCLLLVGTPATLLPRVLDRSVVKWMVRVALWIRPGSPTKIARRMASVLGRPEHECLEAARVAREVWADSHWLRLRNIWRPAYTPPVEVVGLDHLVTSIQAGRGVILWRMNFCDKQLGLLALQRQGIPVVHLSNASHGTLSDSFLSRHVLAPLYRRSEDHFLAERVVIPWSGQRTSATRRLLVALEREQSVLSIFGDTPNPQSMRCSVLGRTAWLASGAPGLAWRTGAALLPCRVVRVPEGGYRLWVDAPIHVDRSLERRSAVEIALRSYAALLEEAIKMDPGSYMDWWALAGGGSVFRLDGTAPG